MPFNIPIDLIVYAVIAVFIIARLWQVLGQRSDDEPQRQNPFAAKQAAQQDEENVMVLPDSIKATTDAAQANQPRQPLKNLLIPPPGSLAGALYQIAQKDRFFDEKKFIQGARQAFMLVIENFAKGDLSQIEPMLTPVVRQSFKSAIEARRQAGEMLESRVRNISDAEIIAANIDDKIARVTVHFVSQQINVTRDAKGQILAGDPAKAELCDDVWVFMRDTSSSDPNWQLVETHS